LVIGCKQPFVGQSSQKLMSQNCEYKSTLLRAINEHLVSGNGVLMLNIHKLNNTNKKIRTKKEIQIELPNQLDHDENFN
jgi:ABC-type cobalamin/Fe3+-siderophores transport system ATPase subunit